jgi:hypothetical protein
MIPQMEGWTWTASRGHWTLGDGVDRTRQSRGSISSDDRCSTWTWTVHGLGLTGWTHKLDDAKAAVIDAWRQHFEGTPTFRTHRTSFDNGGHDNGITFGSGAQVTVRSLLSQATVRYPGDAAPCIMVTALVEVRTIVGLAPEHEPCAGCGAHPPPPDNDAMWSLLQHHGSGRIAFARAEDEDEGGDHYPVADWERIGADLWCNVCAADVKAAVAARRKGRKTT